MINGRGGDIVKKHLLNVVMLVAMVAAKLTVNSACCLIVYEPEMPKDAESLID